MKEKSWYMVLVLTVIAVVSGWLLAYFANYTKPFIEKNKKADIEKAIHEVLPGIKTSETKIDELKFKVFVGKDENGNIKGYAVYAVGTGFQDLITVIFGVDKDFKTLYSLRVLEQKETPGLGAKITDENEFLKFWENRNIQSGEIILSKPPKAQNELNPNEVNAISGATISSRSVVSIVNKAIERAKKEIGG